VERSLEGIATAYSDWSDKRG